MEENINIAEKLDGAPVGTMLWSPICGTCFLRSLSSYEDPMQSCIDVCDTCNATYSFDAFGKYTDEGECVLFPSKEMQKWSKFFKKGDIVEFKIDGVYVMAIFERWDSKRYTSFRARYLQTLEGQIVVGLEHRDTKVFCKVSEENAKSFIENIEKRFCGKLNRKTLEIEKQVLFEVKDGNLYTFKVDDVEGEITVVGLATAHGGTIVTFGYQYEIENKKFVADQVFDLNTMVHDELREATDKERNLFLCAKKDFQIRKGKEHQAANEQKKFKTFDKVLVRNNETEDWVPAFFLKDSDDEVGYTVFCINGEGRCDCQLCIRYKGNEQLAFSQFPF